MTPQLFLMNVPYNCSDRELQEWIESRGIQIESVRLIHDLETGASPVFAYVLLKDQAQLEKAILALDGKRIGNHAITARRASIGHSIQPTQSRTAKL
jgi:RNA recognition motif-containing protein